MGREDKPTVWVLTDDRPGNNSQSIGLAEALGWPYEKKPIQFYRFARFLARLPNGLLGISRVGIRAGRHSPLLPPWPDLVIATGRRLAPLARWIGGKAGGILVLFIWGAGVPIIQSISIWSFPAHTSV